MRLPLMKQLAFYSDHLPQHIHLVITTRQDPLFPLSRLRARGQMAELRTADLRFTPSEAADFLNQMMGLSLSEQDIAALDQRTEGWVAGLQLAALSMRGQTDTAKFIEAFTGSHRFVLDYLVEEALGNQPSEIRQFLLQTAILKRLSADLCKAVTGRNDSQQILESLERGNLFIVPLDAQRQWYRYHHLFADVLQVLAQNTQPDDIPLRHQQASDWHNQQGNTAEAIRHALTAEDFDRAANLIERSWRSMDRSFQEVTWLSWATKLPDEVIRQRPVLSAGVGWASLDTHQFMVAQAHLQNAERWLENPSADMVVADEAEFASLPATLAAGRAYLAYGSGDLAATEQFAQKALDLISEDDHFYRGVPALTLGLAQWANGKLPAASRSFIQAITNFELANNVVFELNARYVLGDILFMQGRLREAKHVYEQAISQVRKRSEPLFSVLTNLYLGLSKVAHAQGDYETALEQWEQSKAENEQSGRVSGFYPLDVMLAQIKQRQKAFDEALALLEQALAKYQPGRVMPMTPISATQARVWITAGKLDQAPKLGCGTRITA